MDFWGSQSSLHSKNHRNYPKDHNFECSAAWKIFKVCKNILSFIWVLQILGFSSLLTNLRLNLLRVDDARNLHEHLGLLQTTISGFPMVAEMDTDVTNAIALVQQNAFVRSSASCTGWPVLVIIRSYPIKSTKFTLNGGWNLLRCFIKWPSRVCLTNED